MNRFVHGRFHDYYEETLMPGRIVPGRVGGEVDFRVIERELAYDFRSHFHPYVGALVDRLIEGSVAGLQEADTEYARAEDGSIEKLPDGSPRPRLYEELFAAGGPYNPSELVGEEPVADLDFSPAGPYAVYNWELFFHVPLMIAIHLCRNQRHREAMPWFGIPLDLTADGEEPSPDRYWKVKPFRGSPVRLIEEVLVNLSTGSDPALREETVAAINAWKDTPFRPHAIARHRHTAYMLKTVMAYLDNLIAWGDSLFQQDTRESINEATQLYVLAANILGPRPQDIPKKGSVKPQTYASLRADLNEFGDALEDVLPEIPFELLPHPTDSSNDGAIGAIESIGRALYFCVPRNEKLSQYWTTVADRLFKIRNSLDLEGSFRQLALFEPPIDPALLAQATAAGVDVDAVLSGASQPLPLVRFRLLVENAAEVCEGVKALGNGLLAAIEKEDGEQLALLRAKHERTLLELAKAVKRGAFRETVKAREGLEKSLAGVLQRYRYYERLLGVPEESIIVPEFPGLDGIELETLWTAPGERGMGRRSVPIEISNDPASGGHKLNNREVEELTKLSEAQTAQDVAAAMEAVGSLLNLIPAFSVDGKPLGVGAGVEIGGMNLSQLMSSLADVSRAFGARFEYEAGKSEKMAAYARREQDWAFESNAARSEAEQIFKQLRAAQIREMMAKREWEDQQKQIDQAKEVEAFLKGEQEGKTTNEAFYAWLKRETRGLYGQLFQFAFDVARKAERALQQELGDPGLSLLQTSYMSGREGLLAGERLQLDLKRMEMAYHELNEREYELTKHVSLLQLNPLALMELRATGACTVALPEELFDFDGPGHYFRRLRGVAVSIPSVSGPYTSVNCTLSLQKSSVRRSPQLRDDGGYARDGLEDGRFSDHFGSLESIVTSSAQADSGLFDPGGGERRAPFVGAGAISEWRLKLPGKVRQFDYDSIADVMLQVLYTAREGGVPLRNGAVANLEQRIDEATTAGSLRLFSVRHDFPSEWARFQAATVGGAVATAELALELLPQHYPFWSRGRLGAVKAVSLFARTEKGTVEVAAAADGAGTADVLRPDASLAGLCRGELSHVPLPSPVGPFSLHFKDKTMSDLWLLIAWGKAD